MARVRIHAGTDTKWRETATISNPGESPAIGTYVEVFLVISVDMPSNCEGGLMIQAGLVSRSSELDLEIIFVIQTHIWR